MSESDQLLGFDQEGSFFFLHIKNHSSDTFRFCLNKRRVKIDEFWISAVALKIEDLRHVFGIRENKFHKI